MRWAGVPHHTTTLAACTVAYFGARIGQVGLSPIVPAVTTVFDVSTATIGIALSGMWVAYACTQVPSSLLAARVGPRATVLTALGVGAATLVVVEAAPIWPVFFLGVVVWAFRPGSRKDHEESANLIFRNEKAPAGAGLEEAEK